MGLLDDAAARYTRLQSYPPEVAHQEARDWALLHHALTTTVLSRIPPELTDRLCRVRDFFLGRTHPDHLRAANLTFFHTLRNAAPRSTITLGATAPHTGCTWPNLPFRTTPTWPQTCTTASSTPSRPPHPDHAHRSLITWLDGQATCPPPRNPVFNWAG